MTGWILDLCDRLISVVWRCRGKLLRVLCRLIRNNADTIESDKGCGIAQFIHRVVLTGVDLDITNRTAVLPADMIH